MAPSVTSALVDNLINNNPTPQTVSSVAPTTVSPSAVQQNIGHHFDNEKNANPSAIDALAANTASQLFVSSTSSNELIQNEQTAAIQPPSSIPAMYQQQATAPQVSSVNQHFVQSEGELKKVFVIYKLKQYFLIPSSGISCSNLQCPDV